MSKEIQRIIEQNNERQIWEQKEKEKKEETRKGNFRFWFPILSADLLSVAAIIISIISLLRG